MRKILMGVLLAATAAAPALADKGGKGGGKHGGGKPAAAAHHGGGGGGGGKHAWRGGGGGGGFDRGQVAFRGHGGGDRGPKAWRGGGGDRGAKAWRAPERHYAVQDRRDWRGGDRFDRPVRVVRYDGKHERKAWKQAAKQERRWAKDEAKFVRAVARERYAPVERWAPPVARYYERPIARYYQQPAYYAPVRYLPAAAPVWGYAASNDWWGADEDWGYDAQPLSYGYYDDPYAGWPTNYASAWPTNYDSPYADAGSGLFGGGDGLLGALLPIVLSSVLGGGGDLGLGGLGGIGGLGGLGGLTGLSSPSVLPLEQVGYADPYGYDNGGGLSSLLTPALFGGGGSLF